MMWCACWQTHPWLGVNARASCIRFPRRIATAEAVLTLGFYLGFTGPLTFKKADDLRAIAAQVPLDRLLVETDAPFLAPQPLSGQA